VKYSLIIFNAFFGGLRKTFPSSFFYFSQIQFLSLEDDIGERKECFRSTSELSGDFVVEEVRGGANKDQIYRRLVFLNSSHIIQSEARLKKCKF